MFIGIICPSKQIVFGSKFIDVNWIPDSNSIRYLTVPLPGLTVVDYVGLGSGIVRKRLKYMYIPVYFEYRWYIMNYSNGLEREIEWDSTLTVEDNARMAQEHSKPSK